MNSFSYEIPKTFTIDAVLSPFLRAEDAIIRLDERARLTALREGWMARLLYHEACACRLAEGELVHLEDLVLLDGGVWKGGARDDLSSAWHVLSVWRKAAAGDASNLLRSERPGEAPLAAQPPKNAPEYFFDPDWDEAGRLEAWRRILRETERLPPLLAAAIAWDAWLTLQPDQRGAWRAPLIAALVLRARGVTRQFLLPLDTGRRFAKYRRHMKHGLADRVAGFMEWDLIAAERAGKDLDKLLLAEELLRLRIKGCQRNSRLPALVVLLLSRPLVSVPMAAKALKVSNQAVDAMLAQLGSIPRELTGRGRYRAWGIV